MGVPRLRQLSLAKANGNYMGDLNGNGSSPNSGFGVDLLLMLHNGNGANPYWGGFLATGNGSATNYCMEHADLSWGSDQRGCGDVF